MLISLEGLPGVGKSTQGRMLADCLRDEGTKVLYLPELQTLTTDGVGSRLFELFALSGDPFRRSGDVVTDTFLASAIRAHILATHIEPALEAGYTVIEDRGAHTMYSYSLAGILQHHGMKLGKAIRWLKACGALAGREADIAILLLLPPEEAAQRVAERQGQSWSDEQMAFLRYVDRAYHHLEAVEPRLMSIDAEDLSRDDVHAVIYDLVTRLDERTKLARDRVLPGHAVESQSAPDPSNINTD
jgi:dTMP kinase